MAILSTFPFLMFLWYSVHKVEGQLQLGLPEGSTCFVNNATGTCVKIHKCPVLIVDIMQPDSEKIYPAICSIDGNTPIVCCTSCKSEFKYDDISTFVHSPSGTLLQKNGKKIWDKCLEYSQYEKNSARCWLKGGVHKKWNEEEKCHYLEQWKFIAGAEAMPMDRKQYTHVALLGYGTPLAETQWLCAGSLISEHFILTAAHCSNHPTIGPVTYAALGVKKRSDTDEHWQKYKIESIVPYPEYIPSSIYHDIALLKTEIPVTFNSAVFPACIGMLSDPDTQYDDLDGVTAAGWEDQGYNVPLDDSMRIVSLHSVSDNDCSRSQYPPHRYHKQGYNKTTQICYRELDGQRSSSSCLIGSGGPAQTEYEDLCMFAVVGVKSFGRDCMFSPQAGMYTRVPHYVPWIEAVVWPEP